MTSKKKTALTQSQFARTIANMDGKYQGLTQKEVSFAMKLASNYDFALRCLGYKSPLHRMCKKNVKRVKAWKAKKK